MSVFVCNSCNEDYNEERHRPLSLTCGHVFCEACIITFDIYTLGKEKEREELSSGLTIIKCPTDHKHMKVDIKKIPCCYQILTNLPKNSNRKSSLTHGLKCPRHPDKQIKYYCKTHALFPCTICVADHMTHELETFEGDKESFTNEVKSLKKNVDSEIIKLNDMKTQNENMERHTVNYYNTQFTRIENNFEKIVTQLMNNKKNILEEIKTSFCEHKKKSEDQKVRIGKKLDSVNNIKSKMKIIDETFESKNYEEFWKIKQNILYDLKIIYNYTNNNTNNIHEASFAFFTNDYKIEDTFGGSINYYKNIQDVEKSILDSRIGDDKAKTRLKRQNKSSCTYESLSNNSNTNSNCTNGEKMENIFQDNLLNENNNKKENYSLISPLTKNIISNNNNSHQAFEAKPSIVTLNTLSTLNMNMNMNTNNDPMTRPGSKLVSPKDFNKDGHLLKSNKFICNPHTQNLEGTMSSKNTEETNDTGNIRRSLGENNYNYLKKQPSKEINLSSHRESILNNISNSSKLLKYESYTNSNQTSQTDTNLLGQNNLIANNNYLHKHNRNEKVVLSGSGNDNKINTNCKSPIIINKTNINRNIILNTTNNNNVNTNTNTNQNNNFNYLQKSESSATEKRLSSNKNLNLNLNLNLNIGDSMPHSNLIISKDQGQIEKRSTSNKNEIKSKINYNSNLNNPSNTNYDQKPVLIMMSSPSHLVTKQQVVSKNETSNSKQPVKKGNELGKQSNNKKTKLHLQNNNLSF